MRILAWHVHGSWMTSFVHLVEPQHGGHEVLVPVLPDRGPDGRGRADTYPWPDAVAEVTPEALQELAIDVVLLQRPHELDLLERWTGLRAGVDVPAVYVEHNTPRGDAADWRHPLADRPDIPVVHVTDINAALYDNGIAPVRVIDHGIPDPGLRYSGERESLGVCCNEPVRRRRVAGMDVVAAVARHLPLTVYGMGGDGLEALVPQGLQGTADLPQDRMHDELARHRAYLHPYRWTSLGLSLLEAMALGMPVLALAATAARQAVPPSAGVVSHDPQVLADAARRLVADPSLARELGRAGRSHVLQRHGLNRFLHDWDTTLKEVAG